MRRPLISDQWAREYHSDEQTGIRNGVMITPLTFCGTLEEFYKVIARFWKDTTRKKYDRDYNNVILPHIDNHNTKIISSYTKEDCEEMLRRIQEDGYDNKGVKCEYSENAINHFKYLIYSVFFHAANAGYCDRFLWGTKFELNFGRETIAVRSKTQIKRSLSIDQEKALISILMESPRVNGKRIALLLMFALGLRDGEACGLDFGEIYELPYYSGCYVAVIKQSTIPNTSILQSSGKTWNTGRRIPIPGRVAAFLLERKAIVTEIIEKNGLEVDINRIPVAAACALYDDSAEIGKRLKADDVTEEAKKVFRQAGIASEVLATLEIEMEEENARLEISESNVTAYLLRRNFATHLKILGVDYPDIQYLLGHCIDDPYINRPDYTDSKLHQLSERMANRPLVNDKIVERIPLPGFCEERFSGNKTIQIESSARCVRARIYALEKYDKLKIKPITNDPEEVEYTVREGYKAYEMRRTIDVLKKYTGDYVD